MSSAEASISVLERRRREFKLISQRNRTVLHRQFKKWKAIDPMSKTMTSEQLEEIQFKIEDGERISSFFGKETD